MAENRFREAFNFARREFFPRWDRKKDWRARLVKDLDGKQGYCDSKSKMIKAAYVSDDDNELAAFLIHEIAHAVTPGSHGNPWLARMEKAAEHAVTIGRLELARLIRDEIEIYKETPKLTATCIYACIEDAVQELPNAIYWQVVDYVRREHAGMSRRELKRYPRTRRVFEAACSKTERIQEQKAILRSVESG